MLLRLILASLVSAVLSALVVLYAPNGYLYGGGLFFGVALLWALLPRNREEMMPEDDTALLHLTQADGSTSFVRNGFRWLLPVLSFLGYTVAIVTFIAVSTWLRGYADERYQFGTTLVGGGVAGMVGGGLLSMGIRQGLGFRLPSSYYYATLFAGTVAGLMAGYLMGSDTAGLQLLPAVACFALWQTPVAASLVARD